MRRLQWWWIGILGGVSLLVQGQEAGRDLSVNPLLPSEIAPTETDATAEKLIDLHLQARGGEGLIAGIRTIDFRGVLREGKTDWNIRWRWKAPDSINVDQWREHLGREHREVRATNGENWWSQTVSPDVRRAKALTEAEQRQLEWDAICEVLTFRHLLDWRRQGHVFAYEGERRYHGRDVYLVKGKLKNGPIVFYYLDKQTFLLRALGYRDKFSGTEVNADMIPTGATRIEGVIVETGWTWQVDGRIYRRLDFEYQRCNRPLGDDHELFAMPELREVWLRQRGQ